MENSIASLIILVSCYVVILAVMLCIYFIPAFVGRKKKNANAIFLLNFFLGWTFIGWVVALVWASTYEENNELNSRRDISWKKCPLCAENIKVDAKVCRYCGLDLSASIQNT